jgi:glycosyltransferase involved in cell wall biosynthesis
MRRLRPNRKLAALKVLHVFKTYLPGEFGGTQSVIHEIAEGTYRLGVETEVLSLGSVTQTVEVGHHLSHQVKRDLYVASTDISFGLFAAFPRLAAEADILHYHFPWPVMDVLHLLRPPGKPAIVTYHSDIVRQKWLRRFYAPVMHKFLGSVDRIVATSPNYIATSPVLQRYRDKTVAIPIGVAEAPVPAPERLAHCRGRLGDRFFLFVGALRYYKGLPFLLEAARLTGLPVVIVGTGELLDEVTRTAPATVTVMGEVAEADKTALLALSTAFVFPSHLRSEAFGVALLEAARAGKPMLSCEIGTGTSYVNVDGLTGLTVPPADPAALAIAMRQLWDNPALAAKMGQAARTRYETLFTGAQMAAAYHEEYQRLLG